MSRDMEIRQCNPMPLSESGIEIMREKLKNPEYVNKAIDIIASRMANEFYKKYHK
jgi:hypothetical protein